MNAFCVWVRPLENQHLVCVDGVENAKWLLTQLSHSFIFRSAEPIRLEEGSSLCTFRVPYNSNLTVTRFNKLLAAIPGISMVTAQSAIPKRGGGQVDHARRSKSGKSYQDSGEVQ